MDKDEDILFYVFYLVKVSRSSTVTGSTSTSRSKTYDQGSDTSDDQAKISEVFKETPEELKEEESEKKIPESNSLSEPKNIDKTIDKTDYHLDVLGRKDSIHSLVATNAQETIEEELEDDSSSQTESEPETEFSSRIWKANKTLFILPIGCPMTTEKVELWDDAMCSN